MDTTKSKCIQSHLGDLLQRCQEKNYQEKKLNSQNLLNSTTNAISQKLLIYTDDRENNNCV